MSRAQPADRHGVNDDTHEDDIPPSSEPGPEQDSDSESVSTSSAETTSSSGSDSEDEPDGQHEPSYVTTGLNGNGASDEGNLRTRLAQFLPQLADANRGLAGGGAEQIDVVGEDEEQYVEMDLGLGVLEERRPGGEDEIVLPKGEPEDSEDSGDGENDVAGEEALAALKGEAAPKKRGIEEVD